MTDEQDDDAAKPGRRRLVLAGAASVLVVALVVVLVAVGSGDDRPVPRGALPTLDTQFATPPTPSSEPTGPAEPASPPRYSGSPLWTLALPGDVDESDLPELAVTDHGFVLRSDKEILGLNRAGKEIWSFVPRTVDDFTMRAGGPVVFVGYSHPTDDRWPQPEVVIALDAATGKERWREDEASLWSATTDTVYLSVCYGGQNGRIGDCQLSARDPSTNATRWSIPTYASSRVINDSGGPQAAPTPPYLLVGSYPTGSESFTISSHDPDTGRTLGSGYDGPDGVNEHVGIDAERTVMAIDDYDENPADGCRATLTGYALSGGAPAWKYVARTAKTDAGRRCARVSDSLNDGRLGVTAPNGRPSVLNVDTGAIEWTAPAPGQALAASGTTLLVVSADGGAPAELTAYRVGKKKPLWRAPFSGTVGGSTVTVTNTTAVVHDLGGAAVGYDLRSGKAWSYGETVEEETDTWIAVCDNGSCRGYALR